MENEYPDTVLALRPQIALATAFLSAGLRPSGIANLFHAQGLGDILIVVVFKESTGASLADLKSFGQWWGAHGVTNEVAFNAWAAEVLYRSPA